MAKRTARGGFKHLRDNDLLAMDGNVIAPVTPGVTYYARVRARNGAGVSDWSGPVSLIAR